MCEEVKNEELPAIKYGKCPRCSGRGFYIEYKDIIDICMVCKGNGKLEIHSNLKICGACHGMGEKIINKKTPVGIKKYKIVCDRCKGRCIIDKSEK